MSLEQPGPRKRLTAHVTLVAEVVREHVHRQGRHAHVHLPAHTALFRALRVQRFVRLLVAREVAARGVVFTTFRAAILGLGGQLKFKELLFGAAVASKEGLVGVGRGAAAVDFVDSATAQVLRLRLQDRKI